MGEERDIIQNNWNVDGNNSKDKKLPDPNEETVQHLGEIVVATRVQEFFSEVSIAGLKYVVINGAMYSRKAIWLICVLCGFGFMIYQFYDRISYFISNPTTVKISIKTVEELEFPTITVCNENLISKSLTDKIPDLTDVIADIYPPWHDDTFTPNFDRVAYIEKKNGIEDWSDIWYRASPFFDTSGQHAMFNDENLQSAMKIVSTEMGFCEQFNGVNSSYISTLSGVTQGFWMVVNISQNDYLYANSRMAGLRVAVHEKHEVPSFNQYSIKAAPGYITSIGMNKRTITDLPSPYTNCSDQEGYSNQQCLRTCYEKYVTDSCKCRIYYFASDEYPTCDPQEMYECADPRTKAFRIQHLAKQLCSCNEQCVNTKYFYTISSAPASEYAMKNAAEEELKEALCDEHCNITDELIDDFVLGFRRDIVEVEVFFQDLKVEEVVTQKAYTTLALLCDIGGALGLILGATILTVFEIMDFALVLLYDFIRYKIARRNNKIKEAKETNKF